MTAPLLAALATIRDLYTYSDADVMRDTLTEAKSIADKAIKAHKRNADKVADKVAARLFPGEVADGTDCRAEIGREGQPCRVCASRNAAWTDRVREARDAIQSATQDPTT